MYVWFGGQGVKASTLTSCYDKASWWQLLYRTWVHTTRELQHRTSTYMIHNGPVRSCILHGLRDIESRGTLLSRA